MEWIKPKLISAVYENIHYRLTPQPFPLTKSTSIEVEIYNLDFKIINAVSRCYSNNFEFLDKK